ncbi:hypothetical protein ACOJIU_09365 [Carnobacterium maltaromaticum]|uniref:hypothetical protein n=2 Tax=Carnobacterium maltaromaticum TaxID=2751 RepID=UPI003B98417E
MDKQDKLDSEYRSKRREYEEQEDELLRQRDKGLAVLDEVADMSDYYLRDFVPDRGILMQGMHELEQMKEEVIEAAQVDRKQIDRKMEDLEQEYYKNIRNLSDNQEEIKGGNS